VDTYSITPALPTYIVWPHTREFGARSREPSDASGRLARLPNYKAVASCWRRGYQRI